MRRILKHTATLLLWLLLCTLFLSGCQTFAPSEIASAMPDGIGAAEYSFLESLYLFVGTDYGEFCAIIAVVMATQLLYVLKSVVYPWIAEHAPRLADALKRAAKALACVLKSAKTVNNPMQIDDKTEQTPSIAAPSDAPSDAPPSDVPVDARASEAQPPANDSGASEDEEA